MSQAPVSRPLDVQLWSQPIKVIAAVDSTKQPSTYQVSRLEPRGPSRLFLSFHALLYSASPQVHDPGFSIKYLSFHATSCLKDYNCPKFRFAALQPIFHTAVILLKYNWDYVILSAKPFGDFHRI